MAIKKEIKTHPCVDCGKPCSVDATRCYSCALRHKWKTGKMASAVRKGKDNARWKGGRINNQGYIYIMKPEHHHAGKSGYVAEHIVVWEMVHGKPLPGGWVVHHLNGIRSDNRPENLKGLPNKKHSLLLQAMSGRIQQLEGLLKGQPQLL